MTTPKAGQEALPIQPVERPILCPPYTEPVAYWEYDTDTGEARRVAGRRPAGYYFRTEAARTGQLSIGLPAEENRQELQVVNRLRDDVKRWRASNYEGATPVTKELLRFWWRDDRPRRLFFC